MFLSGKAPSSLFLSSLTIHEPWFIQIICDSLVIRLGVLIGKGFIFPLSSHLRSCLWGCLSRLVLFASVRWSWKVLCSRVPVSGAYIGHRCEPFIFRWKQFSFPVPSAGQKSDADIPVSCCLLTVVRDFGCVYSLIVWFLSLLQFF